MAQNISPDRSQSSNLAKQNDEAVTIKDNHAVSKRFVSSTYTYYFSSFFHFQNHRTVQNKVHENVG